MSEETLTREMINLINLKLWFKCECGNYLTVEYDKGFTCIVEPCDVCGGDAYQEGFDDGKKSCEQG